MSKKRSKRSSTKDKHQNLLQFQFKNDPSDISLKKQSLLPHKNSQRPKSLNNYPETEQLRQKKQIPEQSSIKLNLNKAKHQNSITTKAPVMIKKKVTKQQENEGLKIIKEKETKNIFRHFCNPEGIITVQSLGSVLVRAKKQFQTQDLENMIAYFDTISKKLKAEEETQARDHRKAGKALQKAGVIKSGKAKHKILPKIQIKEPSDSASISSSDKDKSIDEDVEIEINSEAEMKAELNYEEFKVLLKYFDKA